ncbi:acyltransferase family protein [Caulobacter sp. SLTY]|uniref:acyltransferase family protein n=1 Tax=Caulobacter sp. SLTY TaxID=2683262 RepID=UPI0014122CCB|nr:acyltransferase [Caulobacter sp. SLTY]NBB16043.1 acyltransferase family protein [Caulobacter sp. SLTY]
MTRGEIVGIQYLRGLAALAVVVDHAAASAATPKYFGQTVLDGFLYRGAAGVDLFFLISGFIITVVSLDRDWKPTMKVGDFFGRRFLRIVPMMWLAVLSYAALRYLGRGEFDGGAFLRAMVAWPVGTLEPLNIWTLRHEFIFYTVFAISMLGPRWLRPLLVAWCVLPLLLLLGPQAPALVKSIGHAVNVEFGAGVLIGLFWLKRPDISFRLPFEPYWLMALAMVALMGFAALIGHEFHLVTKTLLIAAFCAPIILLGVYVHCPRGWVARVGLLLGNASYVVYLFHPHVLSASAGVWARLAPGTPVWVVIFGLILLSMLACLAVHLMVEKPLLGRVRRWQVARRSARAGPETAG